MDKEKIKEQLMDHHREVQRMRSILLKFKRGDHIPDQELDDLIKMFRSMYVGLEVGGQLYQLVWRDNFDNLERALSFRKARKEKN